MWCFCTLTLPDHLVNSVADFFPWLFCLRVFLVFVFMCVLFLTNPYPVYFKHLLLYNASGKIKIFTSENGLNGFGVKFKKCSKDEMY